MKRTLIISLFFNILIVGYGGYLFFNKYFAQPSQNPKVFSVKARTENQMLLKFLSAHFDYDFHNFKQQRANSFGLLSARLRSIHQEDSEKLLPKIESNQVVQNISVRSLILDADENVYYADLVSRVREKLDEKAFDWRAEFKIESVAESNQNPFGWEIQRFEPIGSRRAELFKYDKVLVMPNQSIEMDIGCVLEHIKESQSGLSQLFFDKGKISKIMLAFHEDAKNPLMMDIFCSDDKVFRVKFDINQKIHTGYFRPDFIYSSISKKKMSEIEKLKPMSREQVRTLLESQFGLESVQKK